MRSGVLTADARNGLLLAACTSSFLSQIAVIRVACCPNPNDRCQDACRVHTVGQKPTLDKEDLWRAMACMEAR